MSGRRSFLLLFAATAVVAAPPAGPSNKPRLVLGVVIDQFRYDYLLRFRSEYNGGLARLLEQGAVFTDAHYLHAATVTAVGHSTFLTGATPSISGIVGNDWYDRTTEKTVTSVSDPSTKMVGGVPGATGSSPNRLLVSTVGDEVKMRFPGSKAISVSIKDRSAILPGGHTADAAYWFDNDSSHWVTSTYYLKELPEWVKSLNAEKINQRYIGKSWLPFDAKDENAKPFCSMVAGGDVRFCGGLESTPWGNEIIEEFAERALTNENLGHHNGIDMLTVSFSSNDYVGHAVGPDDPAVRDISIRTDRLLGKLIAAAEKQAGAGNVMVVLTADHGVAPVPEVNQARHMPGGRLSDTPVLNAITEALTRRFGPGQWVVAGSATMPYLNVKLAASLKADMGEVERVAAAAVRNQEHIARVYTSQELRTGAVQQDEIGRAFSVGFFAPRSGNLFVLPEPYYMFDATGTTHGTPYDYDNHVPLIFMGSGIQAASYARRVAVNDIAPTLATLLGVEIPSGSVGRVLTEVVQ